MAGWRTVLVCNDAYSVSARPLSLWALPRLWSWRWWPIARHIPFFVGSSITFECEVTTTKEPEGNDAYWQLLGPGSEQAGLGKLIETSKHALGGNTTVRLLIVTDMLPVSGEWQLKVGPHAGPSGETGPNVYVFNAVTLEGMLVKLIAPLMFGFASIGLGIVNACNP